MRSPPAAAELSPMAVHGVAQTRAAVLSLGAYAPPQVLTNDDLARLVDTSDEWITTRTGIKRRHVAGPDQATSDLAVIAAQQALDAAAVRAQDLDLIVVGTATPDMLFPATACLLQERLGAPQAGAFDLLAACSSFVYGLITAGQMLTSGLARTALVVGAETLSRLVDWKDRTTCVLIGDGAGAAVLGASDTGRWRYSRRYRPAGFTTTTGSCSQPSAAVLRTRRAPSYGVSRSTSRRRPSGAASPATLPWGPRQQARRSGTRPPARRRRTLSRLAG